MNGEIYLELQGNYIKMTGLSIGDYVKLVATGTDFAMGWTEYWPSNFDGDWLEGASEEENIFRVLKVDGTRGLFLEYIEDGEECWFPFFCVEKLENPPLVKVDLGYGCEAIITNDEVRTPDEYYSISDFRQIVEKFIQMHGTE